MPWLGVLCPPDATGILHRLDTRCSARQDERHPQRRDSIGQSSLGGSIQGSDLHGKPRERESAETAQPRASESEGTHPLHHRMEYCMQHTVSKQTQGKRYREQVASYGEGAKKRRATLPRIRQFACLLELFKDQPWAQFTALTGPTTHLNGL